MHVVCRAGRARGLNSRGIESPLGDYALVLQYSQSMGEQYDHYSDILVKGKYFSKLYSDKGCNR